VETKDRFYVPDSLQQFHKTGKTLLWKRDVFASIILSTLGLYWKSYVSQDVTKTYLRSKWSFQAAGISFQKKLSKSSTALILA